MSPESDTQYGPSDVCWLNVITVMRHLARQSQALIKWSNSKVRDNFSPKSPDPDAFAELIIVTALYS